MNNKKSKLWLWIGIAVVVSLIVGGIGGSQLFPKKTITKDSIRPFSLTESSFEIPDFDDCSFSTDLVGMCEQDSDLKGENILCGVSGAKLDSGTLKVDCICEKLPITITRVEIRPGLSGINTFSRN